MRSGDDHEHDDLREEIDELRARVRRLEQSTGIGRPREAIGAASPGSLGDVPAGELPAELGMRVSAPSAEVAAAEEQGVIPDMGEAPARQEPTLDLERVIGTQWLNRAGIVALFVAVAYFLRHAFQNDWVGPTGRVLIGLVAGLLVIAWSERFRRRGYVIFSWSLKAVGLGVLYLSLWAAYQVYDLVPHALAFAGMVAVTVGAVALALLEDSQLIAGFALVGGFATPLLLDTGASGELVLFSYLALLDLGALVLLRRRWWPALVVSAFLATAGLYLNWYLAHYTPDLLAETLVFLGVAFVLFAVAPLVARRRASELDASLLEGALVLLSLLNGAFYFVQAYVLLEDYDRFWSALVALGLAAVFLALAPALERREHADKTGAGESGLTSERFAREGNADSSLLHLVMAVGFMTLAVPLGVQMPWATLVWIGESAVLLLLARRHASGVLAVLGATVLGMAIVRLVAYDDFETSRLLLNYRALTYLAAIVVAGGVAWYLSKLDDPPVELVWLTWIAVNGLALLALTLEVQDFFDRRMAGLDFSDFERYSIIRDFTYSALWLLYGALLMLAGFLRGLAVLRWLALFIMAATAAKIFVYDVAALSTGFRILSFLALGVVLLTVSFAYQRDWLRLRESRT
jgi:uncharacterized membrane protein